MSNFRSGNLVQGQPLGMTKLAVTLSADDQSIDSEGHSLIELRSDNATAANRTFTLLDGKIVGHKLVLELISGSSYSCQLADSGNCKLQDAWEPLQYESLYLFWDGTYWVELSRSSAATSSEVTLATPAITNLGVQRMSLGKYDFAVDGGAIGAIAIGASIPAYAIITRVDYEVLTTLTSATDAATLAISILSANDIVSAVAISAVGDVWDAGAPLATIVDDATSNFIKLSSASKTLVATVAVEALTAGAIRVYAEYMLSEA